MNGDVSTPVAATNNHGRAMAACACMAARNVPLQASVKNTLAMNASVRAQGRPPGTKGGNRACKVYRHGFGIFRAAHEHDPLTLWKP